MDFTIIIPDEGQPYPVDSDGNPMYTRLSRGYREIVYRKDGKQVFVKLHRALLEQEVGPCPPGCNASHLDGDRDNNRPENLAWETFAENNARRRDHGTYPRYDGENNPRAKLNWAKVREIRGSEERPQDLAARFGVTYECILQVVQGKTWVEV